MYIIDLDAAKDNNLIYQFMYDMLKMTCPKLGKSNIGVKISEQEQVSERPDPERLAKTIKMIRNDIPEECDNITITIRKNGYSIDYYEKDETHK